MQRSIRPGEKFLRQHAVNEEESTGSHNLALLGANYLVTSQQSEGSQLNHVYQVTNHMINKDIEKQNILEKKSSHILGIENEEASFDIGESNPN